ncbi:hypothetical protein [Tenacibaculum maritimum]|uniref:hypothetical protein n=1 Tax=Tenacibaculum maritimum TaxID=107401 RepID=UPI000466C965|nr:hypothetical protein [Tenacibaculum maritimum]
MTVVKVLNNQSIIDLSIQITGSVYNAVLLAGHNNLSLTDQLIPGQTLQVPQAMVYDAKTLEYYTKNYLEPATGLSDNDKDVIDGCEGIGCWTIGMDFRVS